MLSSTRPLLRIAVSQAVRRPLQSALFVLGVALGVAVVVAIDLANGSALAAFELSTEAVTGRATHRIVGGSEGLDEALYSRLRTELGMQASAPVVEGLIRVPALGGEMMTLLGVDPFAEPPFRGFLSGGEGDGGGSSLSTEALAAFLTRPGAVLLSRDVAARAGVMTGDPLTLDLGARQVDATVAGLLDPIDALSRRALAGLVLADVATAQEILDRPGRLDRVDLLLPTDAGDPEALLAPIRAILPPGVEIEAAGDSQATVASMTAAFRLNLTALSLLALLVGMFLIFNTVRFSVVQRRPTLAVLRALGVTRREVFALILGEALILGAIGALLGLGLGVVLGRAAVGLVTQTINDLYFVVNVRDLPIPAATLVRGGLLGLGAALVAAFLPALEATSVPPVTALRRSDVEARARAGAPRALAAGALAALVGLGLLALPGERVDLGFAGMAAVIFAFALATPAATLALMALAAPITARLFGPIGRMAPRDVTRALSRTAVAIAALLVAVCVSIGVSLMVTSFRSTVERWLADTLRADIFISPPTLTATRFAGTLDPALVEELARLPGVTGMSTAQSARVRSPELGPLDLTAIRDDIAGDGRAYLDAVGSPAEVWQALTEGSIAVSEPFARRHKVGVGDAVQLVTDRGIRSYPIAGVFYDYGSERGTIFMADAVYRAGWDDDRITSIALFLPPEADADAFAGELRRQMAGGAALSIQSNRSLRAEVMQVFDRAFAITTALQVLAILVAFIGVLSALLALQLERGREFGTLRATGMTEGQLGALSLLETGLMGGVAGLMSWPAGLSLALLLIYVINRRSFGWTIQTTIDPGVFARALALAVAAALLAGIYPALRLRRLPIARVLREE
jgi:putative ABC transport system permease protein